MSTTFATYYLGNAYSHEQEWDIGFRYDADYPWMQSLYAAKPGPPGIDPHFPPPPFAYIAPQVCCMVQQPAPWPQIDPAPVPEASGYALLGIGLFALALLDRRRRSA